MCRGKKNCPWLNGLEGDIGGLIGEPAQIEKINVIKNRVQNWNFVILICAHYRALWLINFLVKQIFVENAFVELQLEDCLLV